jgi:hypothetical protein
MNKDDSFVLVQFKEVNSVELVTFAPNNVSPLQILALAHYLEFVGKSTLQAQEIQRAVELEQKEQEKPKIVLPDTVLQRK